MPRQLGWTALFAIAIFCLNDGSVQAENKAPASRPNIVLMMVDDLGFSDLGCYGSEISTPNIDRLASQGMRFTQFYNTAKCETTRAALLSGLYHPEVGVAALRNCLTFGEALQDAGYTTLMTGKWHLSSNPIQRGFDRYFGHLSGATNFFLGDDTFRLDEQPFEVPKSGFYTTDANTDYAIQFVEEARQKSPEKPFFLYIAFNAPHYPLQAWPEDIAKYRGKYREGWAELRKRRYAQQLKLGIIDPQWELSPAPKEVADWDSLTPEQQDIEDLTMAVYAAMIDRVDQNIGRLQKKLTELGVAENTLIMLLSDNGGCPFQRTKDRSVLPGPAESYWTYHSAWANASNTPFRWYKQNQHEGGISTPLVVSWPAVMQQGNQITSQPGHLVDIMATLLDVAEGEYPQERDGQKLLPLRGKSLLPVFQGKQREPHEALYWQFANNRAVRMGDWKLVSARGGPWELYNLATDRTELNNLADSQGERVQMMSTAWDDWAAEVGLTKKKGKKRNRK